MNRYSEEERSNINRILIIKMSALGDLARTIPTVDAIHSALPDVEIGWVVRNGLSNLLEGNPSISRLFVAPRGVAAVKALGAQLRKFHPDIVLDMQGLFNSSLLSWISGGRRRYTWDSNREMSGLFSKAVIPAPDTMNAVDCLFNFARQIGVDSLPSEPPAYLTTAPEQRERAMELLKDLPRPIVGLHVGASVPNKTWPAANFASLIHLLHKQGMGVVLFGANAERKAEQEVLAQTDKSVRSLVGNTTPRELAACIYHCDLFIGGDTGATHIASLVQTPIIALMGPTSPVRFGPHGTQHRTLSLNLPCSPCYRHPTCGGVYSCMRDITPQQVFDNCVEMLAPIQAVRP